MINEIRGVLDLTEEILLRFGFSKYEVNLSTRPEKAVGGDDIWEKATSALKDALDDKGWSYQIDEDGGAFYGPKIDLKIEDALGRKWQCSTIQACPEFGSCSWILGAVLWCLIKHYAGDFPLWLSLGQARVLPVTDTQLEVARMLKVSGIRAEVCSGKRLPKLIRNAEKQKIPLMAVLGLKEVETQTVTVRSRFGAEMDTMTIDDFISRTRHATENRTFI
ncbi:unnamed protein product [Ilex paraguariensis]|uniref:Anticodon-binding domain-containing protein n=1 Tax=Ilex paraguariensis TaxID=185542 RepID=A0ABC8QPE3_9AQUA